MNGKKILIAIPVIIAMVLVVLSFKKDPEPTTITAEPDQEQSADNSVPYEAPANASKITGLACDNYTKRPFAIMYSGDHDAREYFSNLSKADLVLEMPHRPMHGQPRLMGVFQCETPEIVGPMRSGRTDHISVAGSLDAIYVPWGGSSVGKGLLKRGVIDHIDCNGEVAPGGGSACFRREGPMSQMNKASSSIPSLQAVADKAGYRAETTLKGYAHQGDLPLDQRPEYGRLRVKFEKTHPVHYMYDRATNSYLRFFKNRADIDYATKKQYAPKNLITIITKKDAWYSETNYAEMGLEDPWQGIDEEHKERENGQYPNMQLGDPWFDKKYEGEATFFFNGKETVGTWKREKGLANQFQFFDQTGKEIKFAPGQIWLHVLGHDQKISYEDDAQRAAEKDREAEEKKAAEKAASSN